MQEIQKPIGLFRTLRAVVGAWFSGRPVVIMMGPLEMACPECRLVVFRIERGS